MANGYFVGNYVGDIRDTLVGALLADVHLLLLSKPGWGKTEIALDVVERVAGEDYSFTRFNPSTPPQKIEGMPDPAKLLQGETVHRVTGTPYDPSNKVVILDEFSRANDVIFDMCVDLLNRVRGNAKPTVVGTANFMITNERSEALRDRIGLWCWIDPGAPDIDSVVGAHLGALGGAHNGQLHVPGDLPDWEAIEHVRAHTPGDQARRAVVNYIDQLAGDAAESGLNINNRRLAQWARMLFRVSAFYTDSDDFDHIPDKARAIMRYAYPAPTLDEHKTWLQVAGASYDPLKAAFETALMEAREKLKTQAKNAQDKSNRMLELGGVLNDAQETIDAIAGSNSERGKKAKDLLTHLYAAAIRNDDLDQVWDEEMEEFDL